MTIEQSYSSVQQRITDAARRVGRPPDSVRLVAVSKKQPVEKLTALHELGHRLFGENRVQEMRQKAPLLPGNLLWHLIGPLQKNKIRPVLPLAAMIESVDSVELAWQINRVASELGLFPEILLEINLAGEASKHGFDPDRLFTEVGDLLACERLQICGLMAIPPMVAEAEEARPYFARLRALRDRLQTEVAIGLPELSMGMSADFEVAIEEGATLVRVGSALFGPRN